MLNDQHITMATYNVLFEVGPMEKKKKKKKKEEKQQKKQTKNKKKIKKKKQQKKNSGSVGRVHLYQKINNIYDRLIMDRHVHFCVVCFQRQPFKFLFVEK